MKGRQEHLSEPLKFAIQTPDAYPTRSPCLEFASCGAGKIRTEELTCRIRKLNFVGLGRMLDSRGHVDGITPQIVSKAAAADHTRDRHYAVADRLDLLATEPLSEFVRDGEEAVQHTYRRLRAGLTRGRRKSDDVREEHANATVSISDPFARLKSFSHRRAGRMFRRSASERRNSRSS